MLINKSEIVLHTSATNITMKRFHSVGHNISINIFYYFFPFLVDVAESVQLKDTVYKPLLCIYKNDISKETASLAAFFVSGVLHSHVAYFAFGRGVLKACLFFVTHHYLIQLEKKLVPGRNDTRSVLCNGIFARAAFGRPASP